MKKKLNVQNVELSLASLEDAMFAHHVVGVVAVKKMAIYNYFLVKG